MYTFFTTLGKVTKGVKTACKLMFYKVKYGNRLKVGKNVKFRKGFIINISKNGRLVIGEGTFFNNYCSINCHEKIVIGKNNLFGEGVKIYDHNHVFNDKSINMKKAYKRNPVIIGDRNWFGSNVVILSKARIGDNNVFGANTVINSEYSSDNIVKDDGKKIIEKIKYKG